MFSTFGPASLDFQLSSLALEREMSSSHLAHDNCMIGSPRALSRGVT